MKNIFLLNCIEIRYLHGRRMIVSTQVNPINGNTYHLVSSTNPVDGISWTEARDYADSLSTANTEASLVSIGSQQEQDWIRDSFPSVDLGNIVQHELIWTGLSDQLAEGEFRWEDSGPVVHTNWAPGAPSNTTGDEDFVFIFNTTSFHPFLPKDSWGTYQNESLYFQERPFSALIEVVPVPEPGLSLFTVVGVICLLRRSRKGGIR